jgi:hypothetical protein
MWFNSSRFLLISGLGGLGWGFSFTFLGGHSPKEKSNMRNKLQAMAECRDRVTPLNSEENEERALSLLRPTRGDRRPGSSTKPTKLDCEALACESKSGSEGRRHCLRGRRLTVCCETGVTKKTSTKHSDGSVSFPLKNVGVYYPSRRLLSFERSSSGPEEGRFGCCGKDDAGCNNNDRCSLRMVTQKNLE